MAKSVILRQRKLKSGKVQLYLAINAGGSRYYEALGMSLLPGTDRMTKAKNKQTLEIAEQIAEQRKNEILVAGTGIRIRKQVGADFLLDYFRECAERRTGKTREDWYSAYNHLKEFESGKRSTLGQIGREWVIAFRSWLLNDAKSYHRHRDGRPNTLSQNSAAAIYAKVTACFQSALDDGLVGRDPTAGVPSIPIEESEREYLTEEELALLADTQCKNDSVKRAFLFACMTGLRFSDVKNLSWEQVRNEGTRTRIMFRMKKTKRQMYQDINESAVKLMGRRSSPDTPVFDLPHNTTVNAIISQWVESSGITKHITFHCSRHTCATLLLTKGADIYTTSKILGHSKIQTTQIYGKIIDEKRQRASDLLDGII